MKFCVIRNTRTNNFLGHEIEEGYRYSTYTYESACFSETWEKLKHLVNNNSFCRLTIFENEEKAKEKINNLRRCSDLEVVFLRDLEE